MWKRTLFGIFLIAALTFNYFIAESVFALDVDPGQKIELRQENRLGIPLHRRSESSFKDRVDDGTIAEVLGTASDGRWIEIKLPDGRQGWIVERYVAEVLSENSNDDDDDLNDNFEGGSIKLATWNIAHLRDENDEGPVARKDVDYQRLREIADTLNADIIAVQEIENEAAIQRVFSNDRYSYVINEPQPGNGFPQFTGFVVRQGIDFTENPEFNALQLGNPNLRSGSDITVNLDDGEQLRLLSIHLKSSCFTGDLEDPDPGDDCDTLSQQVPVLEEWIDARADEDIPFIVLGDFNRRMSNMDDLWSDIDDSNPSNADLVRVPGEGATQDCWNFGRYIDFFVLDKRAAQLLDTDSFAGIRIPEDAPSPGNSKLSDHCPISITLNG